MRQMKRVREELLAGATSSVAAAAPDSAIEADAEELVDPPSTLARRAFASAHPDFTAPAAEAILLSVGSGAPWHPEFTHQLFDDEKILGYAAPAIQIRYTDPDLRLSVSFTAEDVWKPAARGEEEGVDAPDDVGACLKLALPDDFPLDSLTAPSAAAPPGTEHSAPASSSSDGMRYPPGSCVASYVTPSTGRTVVIHRWKLDTPQLASYHDRMSTLAIWLIETASPVELEDERWTVYGAYELSGDSINAGCSFIGFATTYAFTNPSRATQPTALRLAQLVLLPAHQRTGHGLRFMQAIHADASALDAYEVSVESPCAGMVALRDVHFIRTALQSGALAKLSAEVWGAPSSFADDAATASVVPLLPAPPRTEAEALCLLLPNVSPATLEPLRGALRCTVAQSARALESIVLARLGPHWRAHAEVAKAFRLWVKRRIFSRDEELRAMLDVEARKAALEDAFQDAYAEYVPALVRCGLVAAEEGRSVGAAYAARVAEKEAREAAAAVEAVATAAAAGGAESSAAAGVSASDILKLLQESSRPGRR